MRRRYGLHLRALAAGLAVWGSVIPGSAVSAETVFEKKSPSDPHDIIYGGRGVSDRSAVAGVCSLIIPGVGQAVNRNPTKKIVTHLVVGLAGFVGLVHPVGFVFGLFHLWSGWDALIDRRGGYINGAVQAPHPEDRLDASSSIVPDAIA